MGRQHKQGVEVQCIACRKTRVINQAEAAELTASRSVPMCDDCCMPMVAKRAFG